MRRFLLFLAIIVMAFSAFALEGSDVVYIGGTVPGVNAGSSGKLDMTSPTALNLLHDGKNVAEIPYDGIESYEHTQELAVKLGVAPTIAVGLIKKRRRNHFIRITYADKDKHQQVVVLEVSKSVRMSLIPVLQARSPQACLGARSSATPKVSNAQSGSDQRPRS